MLPLCLAVRGNVVPDHGAPALPLVLQCEASQILAMNSNVLPEFRPNRKQAQKLVQVDALEILCNTL